MAPSDDALMLLAIMHRHLRSLRLGLDPAYPEEDWGFTAQQVFAVEARYEEGPFPLPAERQVVLDAIERQLRRCSEAIADAAAKRPPS